VRQVLGAVAQLDKAMMVAKLRGARDRKRRQAGWCEGGAPLHQRYPETVRRAKRLYRANPVTGKRRSLRKLAADLAAAGHLNTAQYRGSNEPITEGNSRGETWRSLRESNSSFQIEKLLKF
jgi:DNA invertase Pin-like site-specific DNA recombinase